MMPHKCPVCEGRGSVPAGFYMASSSATEDLCRSCNGSGVLWELAWWNTPSDGRSDTRVQSYPVVNAAEGGW